MTEEEYKLQVQSWMKLINSPKLTEEQQQFAKAIAADLLKFMDSYRKRVDD